MTKPSIAVVLPMREQVTSARAGAVALTVSDFVHASVFHDRLLVVGGTAPGDFTLPYHHAQAERAAIAGIPWPVWRRPSGRYADAVADAVDAHGCVLVEVHNRARLVCHLAKRLGSRVQLCLHLHNDPQAMEGLRTPAERARLLERASIIYCVSRYIRDRFVDGMEGTLERVVVLYNGIPLPPVDQVPREQAILFVGRLIPEKGVEELFGALGHVATKLPDWRAVIIGRAPERDRSRYERMLAQLKAIWAERLVHTASLPHATLMRTYAGAAITVVPSRWQEPFGRTAAEALAAGSAVIASRTGGLPEVLGEAGLLLPGVTQEAIEDAILTLARDPARRDALGKAGQERVAACFEIGLLARRLDAWRERLLAG